MNVEIHSQTLYSQYRVPGADYRSASDVIRLIRDACCGRPNGYKFMPSYKAGMWDGYIHLSKGNSFPTGLLGRVTEILEQAGHDVMLHRQYSLPVSRPDKLHSVMFPGIVLRDYQLDAARGLLEAGRGVAAMATNSGKTEVMAAIAAVVECPVLILTTKKDILHQTVDRIGLRLGEGCGIVGDGTFDVSRNRITLGMVQTLVSRLDDRVTQSWLGTIGCVMYDEVHHQASKTSQKVMFAIPAALRFGFSGTPSGNELSNLILEAATGPIVVSVSNTDLIESGVSARPTVQMYLEDGYDGPSAKFQAAYRDGIVNNPSRNARIKSILARGDFDSALVLVDWVEHGRKLADDGALYVDGSNSAEERKEALESLRAGGSVVVATPIFDEGVDVPAVDLIILAGGGKARRRLLQRIGRGMRQKPSGKLTVMDFVDRGNKYLARHSEARRRVYESEGFEVVGVK